MEILSNLVNLITLLTFIFSGYGLIIGLTNKKTMALKEKKDKELIEIVLTDGREKITLPYKPQRKNITRSEIAGIIGMFTNGKRYDLPSLSKFFYDGSFDKIINGEISKIEIECKDLQVFKDCLEIIEREKQGRKEQMT